MPGLNISPKVSILLPTYNRGDLIIETIESIRNQTYPDWELIILDDGSDDNTEEITRKVKDDRIQFHKSGRTGMVSKLKNMGIVKARGELIAFNDSDDLWAPTKLEKQVAALKQHPEAGFCLTGGYTFRKKDEPIQYLYKQRDGLSFGNIFISMFRSGNSGFTQALLFRKECVAVSGFFDETKPFSDPDFILSLANHFKGVVLFEPLFYRRLHDTNDSREHREKRHYEGLEMIRSYKMSLPPKVFRNSLFRSHINFGEQCLLHKERRKAINSFFNAWKQKPLSIVPLKKIAKAILYSFKK